MRITSATTTHPHQREVRNQHGGVVWVDAGPTHMQFYATEVGASEQRLLHHAARTGGNISAHLLMLHSIPRAERIRLLQESLAEEMESNTP